MSLAEAGVVHGLIEEGIAEAMTLIEDNQPATRVLIARGSPPIPGEDARLVFAKRPLGAKMEPRAADEDRVDYHAETSFENVEDGDLLVTLIPKREGQGGMDVFGLPVPAPNVVDLEITAGENVRSDEDSGRFYATSYGLVRFNRNHISVHPIYSIRQHVDLAIGNIDFIGRTEIAGNVPDGFEIRSRQGIHVRGIVEASSLQSESEITIDGGVMGKERARIECEGAFSARFLNGAHVTCCSDVRITKEIIDSTVHCLGRVILEQGAIINSRIIALKGISTMDAGSPLGVKTSLIAGHHYEVVDRILGVSRDLEKKQALQQRRLDRLGAKLEKCAQRATQGISQPDAVREEMGEIRDEQLKIDRLVDEGATLARRFACSGGGAISVKGCLRAGVKAIVGKRQKEIKKPVKGPVHIVEDEYLGALKFCAGVIDEVPGDQSAAADAPGQQKSAARVLLVDDEEAVRLCFEEMLQGPDVEILHGRVAGRGQGGPARHLRP